MRTAEILVRAVGAIAAGLTLTTSGVGAFGGLAKPKGRALGVARHVGALAPYAIVATGYAVACVLLWRPLPLHPPTVARALMLGTGSILGAAGLALYVSARRALGDMYNVSSILGTELYAQHRLVTSGPYRIVRHPMYVGIAVALVGALLVYRTWTVVFAFVAIPGAVVRAAREDALLASQFGLEFERYRACVPGWVPRIAGRTSHHDIQTDREA